MHPLAHFRTITRHRHLTMRNCFRAGIPLQGLLHDLSKYSPTEFLPGARYYQGTRSPNAREREAKGYSEAWMHHKGRNRHHYEYWNDMSTETHRYEAVPMPRKYLVESLCDRLSASKIYRGKNYRDDDALNYYLSERDTAMLHPETARELERFLRLLAEQGEAAFFAALRAYVRDVAPRNEKELAK